MTEEQRKQLNKEQMEVHKHYNSFDLRFFSEEEQEWLNEGRMRELEFVVQEFKGESLREKL